MTNPARKPKRGDIPVAEIVEACRAWRRDRTLGCPTETLAHKYPVKVILARMEQLISQGLLECGVSVRTAWVIEERAKELGL